GRPVDQGGDTLRALGIRDCFHDLPAQVGAATWDILKRVHQRQSADSSLERGGEGDAFKVNARFYCVFDEAGAFEKQEVMFGSRAYPAKALDQRVLTAGYLLYEHIWM